MRDESKKQKTGDSFGKVLKELLKGYYAILLIGSICIIVLILAMFLA